MITYSPDEPPDEDGALDALYDEVDDALLDGRFADVDAKLRDLDPAKLGVFFSLAWLSICRAAEDRLPAFPAFRARAAAYIRATDPENAAELLRGLA